MLMPVPLWHADMLRGIFTLFDGIGPGRDRAYRRQGFRDWQDLIPQGQLSLLPSPLEAQIQEAEDRYAARDVHWFYERMPSRLAYVLCAEFPEKVTYLDIEATGLSRVYHHLTVVGWARAGRFEYELLGRGRRPGAEFLDALDVSPLVVTFNGNLFDLPFLRSAVALPPLCPVDLRFLAFRLGYTGSLKAVEEVLGIRRPAAYRDTKGEDAPALWFRATRGDVKALRRLLEYNYLDVRGLAALQRRLHPKAAKVDGLAAGRTRLASGQEWLLPVGTGTPPRVNRAFAIPARPTLPRADLAAGLTHIAADAVPLLRPVDRGDGHEVVVVGIDLTGSARRGSGVCILRGNRVEAVTLHEDDDLLAFVAQARPDVVSIDAPLSLPEGRARVEDDDPARAAAGIMRWSERELKRRGVNVYPCLLPSMQKLTARGITLADRIRQFGIPCIESYPGAAQDILSMPRKGVGVEFLRRATHDAGWRLPLGSLSHDELDAVTSAIVGVFFLDDRYEALGTHAEDPMIIPRLDRQQHRTELVVAFSGAIGAGKTTASHWLRDKGFTYGRYSQVIADEAVRRGLPVDRDTLQRLGQDLHERWGQRELGRRLLAERRDAPLLVIDGLRWRSDVAYLRETFGPRLTHVHLDAEQETRRQRAVRDGTSLDSFAEADSHPVEREVATLATLADNVVCNGGKPDELFRELVRIGLLRPRRHTPLLQPVVAKAER